MEQIERLKIIKETKFMVDTGMTLEIDMFFKDEENISQYKIGLDNNVYQIYVELNQYSIEIAKQSFDKFMKFIRYSYFNSYFIENRDSEYHVNYLTVNKWNSGVCFEIIYTFPPEKNKLNWNNPECETTYGTTFTEHGSHHEVTNMMIKAREQGYQLGQWTDDKRAAEFIAKIAKERGVGVHDVPLPRTALESFPSVVYLSTGMKDYADKVRVIVNEDGSVKTAYPFSSAYPF